MEFLKIVLLTIFAAIVYGVAHDQITVRLSLEYFTVAHPPIFGDASPTLLAFNWGVIATWWVGVLLGVPIACCARLGQSPPLSAQQLLRPLLLLLATMAVLSSLGGITGFVLAHTGTIFLLEPFRSQVPPEHHAGFISNIWSHLAAYASGLLGGIALCIWVVRKRRSEQRAQML